MVKARRRARIGAALSAVAAALVLLLLLRRVGQADQLGRPRPAVQLTATTLAAGQQQTQALDAGPAAASASAASAAAEPQQQQEQQQQEQQLDKAAAATIESVTGGSRRGESASGSGSAVHTGIFFDAPAKVELLEEPVPQDCHMELHADYDGPALTWGLSFKKASAAQCCQACKEFQPQADGQRCNVWVYCGSRTGECWSPDIWNHTTGECWLKYQAEWDNEVDRQRTNLAVNRRGRYPDDFRQEHRTAPEEVAWTAGVIPAGGGV